MFETPLFSSETIELTAIDLEKDCVIESRWTHDMKYAGRRWASGIAKPAATFELKKDWEERIKTANEKKLSFNFAIRKRNEPESLLGFLIVHWIEWKNQIAYFSLLFENDEIEVQSGDEALYLLKQLAMDEWNIHYLMTVIPSYADTSISVLMKHGFQQDIIRRQACFYNGKYWDSITLGLINKDGIVGEAV